MKDVIEVSYTGDLLAHRRCARAWAYEKHVGFHPYEQVQAMEGRLIHHAMEWMTAEYHQVHSRRRHASYNEVRSQLEHYFRVLWARGVRTAFTSKQDTLDRVMENLFPKTKIHSTVKAVIEGALHSEYELRSVRKLLGPRPGTKQKLLLTGVLDLVVQQQQPLTYSYLFEWTSRRKLEGKPAKVAVHAKPGDIEIWDYKGTRSSSSLLPDYVRQLLTYAYLYRERTQQLPVRCVLYFVNEKDVDKQLLAVAVDDQLVQLAVDWTHAQVQELQETLLRYQNDPRKVEGGDRSQPTRAKGKRITQDLKAQCTACGERFDCEEYRAFLGRPDHPDIDVLNVAKN